MPVELTPSARPDRTFAETVAAVADVAGWMTRDQAARLWDAASSVPAGGRIVEIGSFQGRSAIVLASAAPDGVEIVTIDPHGGNDRGPQEIAGYEAEAEEDHQIFLANLEAAGVRQRIHHVRAFSDAALDEVEGMVDLLYIDGAHRYRPALADIVSWGARVRPGGTMLIHDSFSSLGVTLALIRALFPGDRFAYVGRSTSMAEYRRRDLRIGGRVGNCLRQAAQLPWFARNLVVKAAISLHLRPLWRLLGSDGTWPY